MPTASEQDVIRKLQERAARGDVNGIAVTYRVTGGSPAEAIVDEEVALSGEGLARARARTAVGTMQEASEELPVADVQALLVELGDAASELIPRSEARFLPDSIVGQIRVTIDGQDVSFFFLADDAQASQHGKMMSPKAAVAVDSLMRLHRRVLQR